MFKKTIKSAVSNTYSAILCSIVFVILLTSRAGAEVNSMHPAVAYITVVTSGGLIQGSGFVISPTGHIVTAMHVLERATKEFSVQLGSKSSKAVTVKFDQVRFDKARDLAVFVLPATNQARPCIAVTPPFKPKLDESTDREVVLMGFPRNVTFAEPDGKINTINESNGLWSVVGVSDDGMSGGPAILKKTTQAVGVLVRKDEGAVGITKISPIDTSWELIKAIVSEAGSACGQDGKITVLATDGTAEVKIHGTGRGKMPIVAKSNAAGFRQEALIEARGGEKSDCSEGFERTISEASARARVLPQTASEFQLEIDISAQGGHYVTAPRLEKDEPICIGPIPPGNMGKDTETWAEGTATAELIFAIAGGAKEAVVFWKNLPTGHDDETTTAKLRLVDLRGMDIAKWDANGDGNKAIPIPVAGTYKLIVSLRQTSHHKGSCCGPDRRKQTATVSLR